MVGKVVSSSSRVTVSDVLMLTMPNRALFSCAALLAGVLLSGSANFAPIAFAFLMLMSTYCSQAVYNNILDVEGDRVDAPDRPLARGAVSIPAAWNLHFLLFLLGLVFAYLASPALVPVMLLFELLGYVYSAYTKGMGVLSYATLVAAHLCIPLLAGYMLFAQPDWRILSIVAFVFFTEVLAFSIKDYKDVEGDRRQGMRTLPVVLGPRRASYVTLFGLLLVPALFLLPWALLRLSILFLALYGIAAAAKLAFGMKLLRDPSPASAGGMLKKFRLVILIEMLAWCLA